MILMTAALDICMVTQAKILLATNLKRIRKERGLTQEQLGKLVGVSAAQVSQWENAELDKWVGGKTVDMLAKALQVKIGELFDDSEKPLHLNKIKLPKAELSEREVLRFLNSRLGGPYVIKKKVSKSDESEN
jgi:transcriptional regulator with XRE-family HTH domain